MRFLSIDIDYRLARPIVVRFLVGSLGIIAVLRTARAMYRSMWFSRNLRMNVDAQWLFYLHRMPSTGNTLILSRFPSQLSPLSLFKPLALVDVPSASRYRPSPR